MKCWHIPTQIYVYPACIRGFFFEQIWALNHLKFIKCSFVKFCEYFRNRTLRPGSYKRYRKRAIFKNGDCNVTQAKLGGHRLRFLQDPFTTLVDLQWRWTLLIFTLSFFLSWLGFAVIWWLIAITHLDLEGAHLPALQGKLRPSIYKCELMDLFLNL